VLSVLDRSVRTIQDAAYMVDSQRPGLVGNLVDACLRARVAKLAQREAVTRVF